MSNVILREGTAAYPESINPAARVYACRHLVIHCFQPHTACLISGTFDSDCRRPNYKRTQQSQCKTATALERSAL